MVKRWIYVALVSLGLAAPVAAQPPMPMQPQGPGPAPGMGPMMPPGGPMMTPGAMPQPGPGGGPAKNFAADAKNIQPPGFCPSPELAVDAPDDCAFGTPPAPQCCAFDEIGKDPCCSRFIVGIGGIGLQRQPLGNRPLGFLDPGINIGGTTVFADTGTLPPAGSLAVINTNNVSPTMRFGPRAFVQWRTDDYALELCGFALEEQENYQTTVLPGRLTLGFAYFPTPVGFTPNNGLFAQADRVSLVFQNTMYNGEANVRIPGNKYFEWIVGARYLQYQEQLGVLVEDDRFTTGVIDRNTTAYYTERVRSRIAGPQIGFETEQGLTSWVAVGLIGKAMLGANFVDADTTLLRGDGFYGPGHHRATTILSQVYELNAHIDFAFSDHVRIRAGYQGVWLVNTPTAADQVNFNLGSPGAIFNPNGSTFFHGPQLELHIAF